MTRDSASPTHSTSMPPGRTSGVGRAKNLAWVRYAPRDMLVAVSGISVAAELAHRRLADMVWAGGEWPVNEPENLARLVRQRPPALPAVLRELFAIGWKLDGEYLHHDAVAEVRREAARMLAAKRLFGKAGAARRWGHKSVPEADLQPSLPIAKPSRSHSPAMPEPSGSHSRPVAEGCTTQDSTNPTTAVNTGERLPLAAAPHKKSSREAEKVFLADVKLVLDNWRAGSGAPELADWGGWWRTAFRKNARKARAVLNDVGSLAKEGRITHSPGAAALDLWKRLP